MDPAARETIAGLRRVVAWTDVILARLREGVVVVRGEARAIRYCNEGFARLAARERIFLLGTSLNEHFPQLEGQPLGDGARLIVAPAPGGGERLLEVESAPVSEGEVVVVFKDVTDERRQAEELRRSNDELEVFAFAASHDLQEPLRKVALFCQQLRAHAQGRLDAESDRLIGAAVASSERMARLIRDLLAYARVGRADVPAAPTDLDAVLAQALDDLQTAVHESRAVVTADPLPTVLGRSGQLCDVFRNLLGNAIKFRGAEPPRVRVSAERQGSLWLISFQDNGIGFDPIYAERIFRMFQRLNPASRYPGTGIGLSLSRRIIEGHGGKLWAESEPGQGSTFRLTLPPA